jgi:hypothetical protein
MIIRFNNVRFEDFEKFNEPGKNISYDLIIGGLFLLRFALIADDFEQNLDDFLVYFAGSGQTFSTLKEGVFLHGYSILFPNYLEETLETLLDFNLFVRSDFKFLEKTFEKRRQVLQDIRLGKLNDSCEPAEKQAQNGRMSGALD